MYVVLKHFKQILTVAAYLLVIAPVFGQKKQPAANINKHHPPSAQLKEFFSLAAQSNVTFVYPKGFREIKAPNNEDFSFDFALELPGKDFEIWFQLKPEKEDWLNYLRSKNNQNAIGNPDSLYLALGKAMALTFTGSQQYFERTIPPDVLARYHADAGKSYLLTLLDIPDAKHYKYALLITLQKNHTGAILAVCFSNDKGPDFFKNINKASHCLKFKS